MSDIKSAVSISILGAVGAILLGACSAQSGETPDDPVVENEVLAASSAMTASDIMARANRYLAANIEYCGGAAGEPDGTDCHLGICHPPAGPWTGYRSDCSGFLSYVWQIPSDPITHTYMTDESGPQGWNTIDLEDLRTGDAIVADGHIKLFNRFIGSSAVEVYEEYFCHHVARKVTQGFRRIGGGEILIDGDDRPYHAIRRNGLTTPPAPPRTVVETAFQANTGDLWTVGTGGNRDWKLGMMAGTSPSITALPDGRYEVAFQANTGELWTVGTAGNRNWKLGMKAGTSPSITALATGGFEVAFQANNGDLWTVGTAGNKHWDLGMKSGTSPSITGLAGGGYIVAVQTNTGNLWTTGPGGTTNWKLGMEPGTSPSITAVGNGYEVAFQANNSDLWTVGTAGSKHWDLGMKGGTSPSITNVGNGYEVALQANTGELWTAGSPGIKRWGLGMKAGTSPSISTLPDGKTKILFQANTGSLWAVQNGAGGTMHLGMKAATSPSGS
ncbi:MAG: hypothetical protein JWP97_1210 [Labilithrix sp.]|nr:hypothetical protein [Labilithrix sp.]